MYATALEQSEGLLPCRISVSLNGGDMIVCAQHSPVVVVEMGEFDLHLCAEAQGLRLMEVTLFCADDLETPLGVGGDERAVLMPYGDFIDSIDDLDTLFIDPEDAGPPCLLKVPTGKPLGGFAGVELVEVSIVFPSGDLTLRLDELGCAFKLSGEIGARDFFIAHEGIRSMVFEERDCG